MVDRRWGGRGTVDSGGRAAHGGHGLPTGATGGLVDPARTIPPLPLPPSLRPTTTTHDLSTPTPLHRNTALSLVACVVRRCGRYGCVYVVTARHNNHSHNKPARGREAGRPRITHIHTLTPHAQPPCPFTHTRLPSSFPCLSPRVPKPQAPKPSRVLCVGVWCLRRSDVSMNELRSSTHARLVAQPPTRKLAAASWRRERSATGGRTFSHRRELCSTSLRPCND